MDAWNIASARDADVHAFGVEPDPLKRVPANRRLRPTHPTRKSTRPRAVSGIRVRLPARRQPTLYDMPWVSVADVAVLVDRAPDYVRQRAHDYGIPLATLPNRLATAKRGGRPWRGRHTVMSQSAYRAFLARYWAENAQVSPASQRALRLGDASEQQLALARMRQTLTRATPPSTETEETA